MFKIGDAVAVLHDTIIGRVIAVLPNQVIIEDSDGFDRTYANNKIVKRAENQAYNISSDIPVKDKPSTVQRRQVIIKTPEVDRYEIDLHIEELRDYHTHYSNFEIVQIQLNACRAFVQESLALKRRRIVIIHGKGQGVLKSEIHAYLNRLSNSSGVSIDYHDASFNEYGMGGATQVLFQ